MTPRDMDDEAAIRDVLAGDLDRFAPLVRRHERAVFALIRSYGMGPAGFGRAGLGSVEDVAQDVFLRAYRALARFDPARTRFASWLYAIARNRCRDLLRRRAPANDPTPTCAVTDPAPTADLGSRLDRALAGLSAERRIAFLLVEVHGFSLADAAEIEGVAVGTIKSRMGRARAVLREILKPEMEAEG